MLKNTPLGCCINYTWIKLISYWPLVKLRGGLYTRKCLIKKQTRIKSIQLLTAGSYETTLMPTDLSKLKAITPY